MSKLAVSVVIPTYNRATLVTSAVESALRAIEPGDEIVVVDDESTDNTAAVLAPYEDRIRLVRAPHGGAGATRNRGVAEARNPLIAFLDSDDEWMPDKLRLQRTLMGARPDVAFCFTDFQSHDTVSGSTRRRALSIWHGDPRTWDAILGPAQPYSKLVRPPPDREDFPVHVGDLYPWLMEFGSLALFTLVMRRDLPGGVPVFPTDLPTFEDWQFAGGLGRRGPAAFLDCETAIHHGHAGPRLTDADAIVRIETRIKVLERVWGRDAAFLGHSGDSYHRVLSAQQQRLHLLRAIQLLQAGRTRESREMFAKCDRVPAKYRFLARLPGVVLRSLYRPARRPPPDR